MNNTIVGILSVVATPIGNLKDITLRAIEVLKAANLIVAEDTRHCKVLLSHYEIKTPVVSLHEHNEKEQVGKLVEQMSQGQHIALVSDAGTPLISDPGYRLVHEARLQGITVQPLPGACAAIAALSVSGLATDRFVFEGFLPMKQAARRSRLELLTRESRSIIFYEAPHRVLEALEDMSAIFGSDREALMAREMTKVFETIKGAPLAELYEWVKADSNQQRGEIVLVVQGNPDAVEGSVGKSANDVLAILLKDLPVNQAVKLATEITGEKKNKLYKQALEWK